MKRLGQLWTVAHPRACPHGCPLTAAFQTQAPHLVWSLLSFHRHVPTPTLPSSLSFLSSCLPSPFLFPPPFTPLLTFHSLWAFYIPAEKSWLPSPTAFAYIGHSVGSVPSAASWGLGANGRVKGGREPDTWGKAHLNSEKCSRTPECHSLPAQDNHL